MAELPPLPVHESAFGDWVVRLDGLVVELFHRSVTDAVRIHVRHLAVEATPRDDGVRLTLGHEVVGQVIGHKVDVPHAAQDEVLGLIAEARRRRDTLTR